MANSPKKKQSTTIVCPHCGTPAGGSFSTVVEADQAGPVKVLYKCQSCGGFYSAERVISWQVNKT